MTPVASKQLSNPSSTGNEGGNFEAHVQASFLALMLAGGHAPCLPCWPIKEIKLQGKVDGYDTDDLIVYVENQTNREKRKLLAQVKVTISITKGDSRFGEVINSAWADYNNKKLFKQGRDVISLITGPMSALDVDNVLWLLNQVKCTKDSAEFKRHVSTANFSPSKAAEKLSAFEYHLKNANRGKELTDDEVYDFLRNFHILSYDLGNEYGVILSLLHSYISLFQTTQVKMVWSRAIEVARTWNQNAGTLTRENIPEDLLAVFTEPERRKMPIALLQASTPLNTTPGFLRDLAANKLEHEVSIANLIGSWNNVNKNDQDIVSKLFKCDHAQWSLKLKEPLHLPNSCLRLQSNQWIIDNRVELWEALATRITDDNIDDFIELVVTVLSENDPKFDLSPEDRYVGSIYGKEFKFSHAIREGVANSMAILSIYEEALSNCTLSKRKFASEKIICSVLQDVDHIRWGSLNSLLPLIAEAGPNQFLRILEKTLTSHPEVFVDLLAEERDGVMSVKYLTGVLWALEAISWDDEFMVRASLVLAKISKIEKEVSKTNRAMDSLVSILLPWYPQTNAKFDKRKIVIETLTHDDPGGCWELLIGLMPNQSQIASNNHKPSWRNNIQIEKEVTVTRTEFWEQSIYIIRKAMILAKSDVMKLSELITHLENFPNECFHEFLEILSSDETRAFPDHHRQVVWSQLNGLKHRHIKFSKADWALDEDSLSKLDDVLRQIAPSESIQKYKHLFTEQEFELYESNDNYDEERDKLEIKKKKAISNVYADGGIQSVLKLSHEASSSRQVGLSFGNIGDRNSDEQIIPSLLNEEDPDVLEFYKSYIWRRFYYKKWKWVDSFAYSSWGEEQKVNFLISLPFIKGIWDRAESWMGLDHLEYWRKTTANPYDSSPETDDLNFATEKLILAERPYAAINCMHKMLHTGQHFSSELCIKSLKNALSSKEPSYVAHDFHIVELIKCLEKRDDVNKNDLISVEWSYLRLLEKFKKGEVFQLEIILSEAPLFFCEILRMVYRPKGDSLVDVEPSEESRKLAINAFHMLKMWSKPPGLNDNGEYVHDIFIEWYNKVIEECQETGHVTAAYSEIGEILFKVPKEKTGLWINTDLARFMNNEGEDFDILRKGYCNAIFNSRGVHRIDSSGLQEKHIADSFHRKADALEKIGLIRLSNTLKDLARSYDYESEVVIDEHLYEK